MYSVQHLFLFASSLAVSGPYKLVRGCTLMGEVKGTEEVGGEVGGEGELCARGEGEFVSTAPVSCLFPPRTAMNRNVAFCCTVEKPVSRQAEGNSTRIL